MTLATFPKHLRALKDQKSLSRYSHYRLPFKYWNKFPLKLADFSICQGIKSIIMSSCKVSWYRNTSRPTCWRTRAMIAALWLRLVFLRSYWKLRSDCVSVIIIWSTKLWCAPTVRHLCVWIIFISNQSAANHKWPRMHVHSAVYCLLVQQSWSEQSVNVVRSAHMNVWISSFRKYFYKLIKVT